MKEQILECTEKDKIGDVGGDNCIYSPYSAINCIVCTFSLSFSIYSPSIFLYSTVMLPVIHSPRDKRAIRPDIMGLLY